MAPNEGNSDRRLACKVNQRSHTRLFGHVARQLANYYHCERNIQGLVAGLSSYKVFSPWVGSQRHFASRTDFVLSPMKPSFAILISLLLAAIARARLGETEAANDRAVWPAESAQPAFDVRARKGMEYGAVAVISTGRLDYLLRPRGRSLCANPIWKIRRLDGRADSNGSRV